jgi:DNA-directed RNA polymerase subunit RPC12/RpoP
MDVKKMKCPECGNKGIKSDWVLYDYYCKHCKRYFRKITGMKITQMFKKEE